MTNYFIDLSFLLNLVNELIKLSPLPETARKFSSMHFSIQVGSSKYCTYYNLIKTKIVVTDFAIIM